MKLSNFREGSSLVILITPLRTYSICLHIRWDGLTQKTSPCIWIPVKSHFIIGVHYQLLKSRHSSGNTYLPEMTHINAGFSCLRHYIEWISRQYLELGCFSSNLISVAYDLEQVTKPFWFYYLYNGISDACLAVWLKWLNHETWSLLHSPLPITLNESSTNNFETKKTESFLCLPLGVVFPCNPLQTKSQWGPHSSWGALMWAQPSFRPWGRAEVRLGALWTLV